MTTLHRPGEQDTPATLYLPTGLYYREYELLAGGGVRLGSIACHNDEPDLLLQRLLELPAFARPGLDVRAGRG